MAMIDKSMYKEIGKRIYNLRSERQYTRAYLASLVHISPKFLYEIENGRKGFTVQVLTNLATIFETSCDYLIRGKVSGTSDPNSKIYKTLELFDNEEQDKIATVLRAVYSVKLENAEDDETEYKNE